MAPNRLLHLNGPPGIGKSTLARRYAEEHPGTLCCDVDVLRTLIGGWRDDFGGAGSRIRPAALAMIAGYLEHSGDVVLPQLLANPAELARFERAALDVGAGFVEVVVLADADEAIARFHGRGASDLVPDPWHDQVRALVAADGGDDLLRHYHARLLEIVAERPDATVVRTRAGEVDAAYAEVCATFDTAS